MNIKRLLPALICAGIPILAVAGTPVPRTVSVTFTVNSVADSVDVNPGNGICQDASGQCSLRAAIMEANALAGPDTIVFDPITDGQPQLLQLHGAGEDAAATGDLDITEGLTITGNGTDKTIIDGDAADRVFDIHPASGTITVEIDDLTVQNGNGVINGGGIRLQNSTLVLNGDLIEKNETSNISGTSYGGGIYATNGTLTLDHATVKDNSVAASARAGGGGITAVNVSVTHVLDGSLITGNVVDGGTNNGAFGGGIYSRNGTLSVDATAIRGNESLNTNANEPAYGGGIETELGSYTITNSEISGNDAHGDAVAFGGGLDAEFSGSDSSVVDTTVTGNSSIVDNATGDAVGGGISIDSTPSGVTESLDNVTISGNSVQGSTTSGGGLDVYQNTGTVSLQNSIVAGNQDANATAPDCVGTFGGALTSGGYNLIGDDTGCSFANATGDQVGTGSTPIDPLLGTLADNGGKTQTMALLAGSPAVDAGNPAGCTDASGATLTRDQRNYPRPTDGNGNGTATCDIGAYERTAELAPTASNGSITVNAGSSASGTLSGSAANGNPTTFSIVSKPSHGTVKITNAATGAFTYEPASGYSGSDSFTFSVNDGFLNSNTATETVTVKSAASGGGGGGGGFSPFALFGLLLLALVPWWLRRHRPIAAGIAASVEGKLPMKRVFKIHYIAAIGTALISVILLTAVPARAAPGDVDTTFNGGVPAVIDPGTGNIYDVLAGAIDPSNGDIFWSGNYDVDSGAIAAYKPDGTPDTTFGGTGEVTLAAGAVGFSGGTMQINGIAIDGQGRILLTGVAYDSSGGGMLIMRLNPDGSFDTSFGAAGTGYVVNPLSQSEGNGLSLTTDGHILVTGDAYDSGSSQSALTIWRFSANGIPDNSFGSGGYAQIATVKDGFYLGCKPGLQADDTLLVGCERGGANDWVVVHIMTDGSLDTSFGSSGFVTSSASMSLFGLALAPDNGFIIGEADYNSPPPTNLRYFLADGSVDTSFNNGNPFDLSTLMGTTTRLPVGAQADAKALISGNNGSTSLNVVRLLTDGTLDSSFGTNGVGTVDFSNIGGSGYASEPTAVLLQGDGKIVVLGYAVNNTDSRRISFVTRLDNDAFNFTPTAFSFMAQTGVVRSTLITSNAITVSGLSSGTSVPVSVSGGEYEINSGAWTRAPGFVQNGDQVAVRHTSSNSYSTKITTTLAIGGTAIPNNNSTVLGTPVTASFSSTTKAAPTSGGGGGGSIGLLALLALLTLTFVPWSLRHNHQRFSK